MKLEDYLFQKRLTKCQFARAIGYTPNQLSRVINGHEKISIPFLRAVEEYTAYMVTHEDLVAYIAERRKKNGK